MQDHTVHVDLTTTPTGLSFAPNFNVAVAFIDRNLGRGRSQKTAIQMVGGEAVTYGALAENVNRVGNVLLDCGMTPGERMLMMVKDCPEFYYLFWGAIKAGIVPVPTNTLLRSHDYIFMLRDSGCSGCVYSPEFSAEVLPAIAECTPAYYFSTEGEEDALVARMETASPSLQPAPAAAQDDCFWLYSSGTTGTPKGAVHAHQDMVVTSQLYGVDTLGLREDDINFSAAKLFFAYGLGNGMTFPLWCGSTAVLLPGVPTPDSTFETIETYRPTVYFGVPTLYAAQLKSLEQQPRQFESLRACVSAGEALPADIYRRWKAIVDVDIYDGIGSTEALHIFISNRPGDVRPGSSGRPVAGYEARILGDDDDDVPVGKSGQLFIRGGSTASRYWNNPDKTTATMIDGWLNTGDTYIRDSDGYYNYCGRNDDMLKVGGIWCSPFEIEARLIEHPKVLEAAVVGRADDDQLVKPEVYVVLNDIGDANEETERALVDHCKQGLAKYKYPRWLHFVEALPKTATGKIQRYRLRSGS